MPKIILSNGVEFECASTQTILDAAKNNKIAIEHSCRSGRCGVCETVVLSGETQVIQIEESLHRDAGKQTKILTCCRSPISDVYLDLDHVTPKTGLSMINFWAKDLLNMMK